MDKQDGGPAFSGSRLGVNNEPELVFNQGMTLRDYFAGKAMATFPFSLYETDKDESIAKASYRLADAMLSERDKK